MSKGIAGMAYLPKKEFVFTAGSPCTIEAIKAVVNRVAQMQAAGLEDATLTDIPCGMAQPYSTCKWDITIADADVGGDVVMEIAEETTSEQDTMNRAALSTRRKIDFGVAPTTNEFSLRSILALLSFIEKLEDQVAAAGHVGATGDATYTNIILKGVSPYETHKWTVEKADDVYTCTATSES